MLEWAQIQWVSSTASTVRKDTDQNLTYTSPECSKSRIKSSTYTENSKGDKTPPCLTPHNITKCTPTKLFCYKTYYMDDILNNKAGLRHDEKVSFMNNFIYLKSGSNEYKYKQTNITKLTLSSRYINRNIMVNHVSECVYTLSYQPNCMRLKISFLICLTEHLVIQI